MRKCSILLLILGCVLTYGGEGSAWSYHGETGPEAWGSLSPDNLACNEGTRQSPINLASDLDDDDDLRAMNFVYADATNLDVHHNGHTIKSYVPTNSGTLYLGQKAYSLLEFHLHSPSEHLVDGEEFLMELHLVHQSSDGEYAVVGVFLTPGSAHVGLNPVFANMPTHGGENHWLQNFNLRKLLPNNRETWRYSGSFTTPPCTEGVRWHVMVQPMTISSEQANAFIQLFSGSHFPDGNRRPEQPLMNRSVVSDHEND